MHTSRVILFFLLLFVLSCSATNSNIRSITDSNIDINSFLNQAPKTEEHPNAGAILLDSYSYIEFYADGTSISRNLIRIKIFNERGRGFASRSISYREGYQRAKILFANTIKPDGKIVTLDTKDIIDSSQYEGYEFYTDIKLKRFTMPAVEDGCIIEYAYEIENLQPVLSFDYYDIYFCQNIFPIENDILEIALPSGIELKYKKFQTTLTPQIISGGNKRRYIFNNTKQKEIIPESRMPSIYDSDIFPQVSFWTLDSWDIISRWYVNIFKEQMQSDIELESFTKQLISGKNTDEEKINAIFNFVSQNIRYIAVLLGPHTHKPHRASEIFKKRYGDCKDKTVLLLTMLKIAGIEGKPALVPANGKYFDESIPSLNAFNHIIALVPTSKKYLWLDATNETAAFNSTPFFIPTKVFVINNDGSYSFIKTPDLDNKKDYYSVDIKYNINNEGNASIDYTQTYFGKAAESVRYSFKYSPPEQRKKYFEDQGIEVKEFNLGSFTDTQKPFTIKLSGNFKNLAQKLDEDTMLLSNIITFDSYRDITAANKRQYPISLKSSFYSMENYSYKFPAGFKIKRLPPAFSFKTPFKYRAEKYSFKGNTFNVHLETANIEQTIKLENINDFKKYALELQKHESSIKNFIFEKK
jgi:hypothetical protein